MTELIDILHEVSAHPEATPVLATLVTVAGSSYRRPGARLLIAGNGKRLGSISGGCLEEDVIQRAIATGQTGEAQLVTYDTTRENDLVWGVGLGCHGIVQVLIERLPSRPRWATALLADQRENRATSLAVVWHADAPHLLGTRLAEEWVAPNRDGSAPGVFLNTIPPPPRLIIFGAGDDAQPLVALAKQLGWHVTVADARADFATIARFPAADALVVAPAGDLVRRIAPPANVIAVVMTHRYLHDVPVLRSLLPLSLSYVGLLGPRARAERILTDLARDGLTLTADQRARLHAPVGLDLGAETPAEVALSIVAEIRATLAQRDARPLRDRTRPIHG